MRETPYTFEVGMQISETNQLWQNNMSFSKEKLKPLLQLYRKSKVCSKLVVKIFFNKK